MIPTYLKAVCFLALSLAIVSCGGNAHKANDSDEKIYELARKANDFPTAINAAYQLIHTDSSYNTYYDNIAYLYQMLGNSKGALVVSEEGLAKKQSLLLKQISAYASMNLGQYTEAVIKYQELMKLDPDNIIKYQYSVGEGFFMLGNYVSSIEYMGYVVENDKSALMDIEIQSSKSVQKVAYKLAAMNSIGYAMMELKQYDDAEKLYQDLISKKADFELANNNYTLLQELKKQGKK